MDDNAQQMDAAAFRRAVLKASDERLIFVMDQVRRALEGDSNDAEHDALVSVADLFGIEYEPFEV